MNTVGRPALFAKLTAAEKESIVKVANVMERILRHVDKNDGFSVDGHDRMEVSSRLFYNSFIKLDLPLGQQHMSMGIYTSDRVTC